MNKLIYILILFFQLGIISAQEITGLKTSLTDSTTQVMQVDPVNDEPKMADLFRSEGKIYVVIAVLLIIFICLIGYLIYIDLKVKKLENKVEHPNNKL